MNRLSRWQSLGDLTFTPDSLNTVVGDFSIDPEHDTIWVEVTSESPPTPWPWSYGVLGWRTEQGYELGSCKAYSSEAGQTFKLGLGLVPQLSSGQITFEPRSFNLAWVRQGNPWTLSFRARSGTSGQGSPDDIPAFGTSATLGVLGDLVGAGVSYAITNGAATIRLLPR